MTFLSVFDNSGFVRVNFISDDHRAEVMNEINRPNGHPAVTSPATMGGYCFPFLQHIVDTYAEGATYQILKAPLPEGNEEKEMFLQRLLGQPETFYGYVDGPNVTIVQIEGWTREGRTFADLGISAVAGPKTFKRLKTLNRPFRLWSIDDAPLRVAIVGDSDYCDEDLEGFSPEEIERLLDGAMVISPRLFDDCLANVNFPYIDQDDDHPEYAVDHYRMREYFRQAQDFRAFNARILGPMHFIGYPDDHEIYDLPGMLKGEAFKDVSGILERMNVDALCAISALKFDVGYTKKRVVLLEPQRAKLSGVNSDIQTMIDLPALFTPDQTTQWVRNYLMSNFHRLTRNEVMESWYDMSSPYFNGKTRQLTMNDVDTLTKWNAREFLMSGLPITSSPWFFERLAAAIASSLRPTDQRKLRLPVPCAVRAQVISASFASAAGDDMEVQQGCCRWSRDLHSLVVNDLDWIEMYPSHGGMDLDDFFVGYYRTVGNCRKIIIVRSPNDYGEYSMFDYVEGDWFPQEELSDGHFIQFPQVSDDIRLWPKRLSEAVTNGEIIYTGLPSQSVKVESEPHMYGFSDVVDAMRNNVASATCVGMNVNARALWSLSMNKHRPVQLTTMESCIDTGTQGGHQDDIQAVHAEAHQIVQDIIASPTAPIDAYLWSTRFARWYNGVPFNPSRLTTNTHISAVHKFRGDAHRDFMRLVREYAQTHLTKNLDPRIHALGARFLRQAYRVLVDTRVNMWRMQNEGAQLGHNDWSGVHSLALAAIHNLEKETDRHDFLLGLYSACFKAPTTYGNKITDQLVMNPHIFPYLLSALRFYGIAFYLELTDKGALVRRKVDNWVLKCVSCDSELETTDPTVVQYYHSVDGYCKDCRHKGAE